MQDKPKTSEPIAFFDGRTVVDGKGRTFLTVHPDGNVVIERYPDMLDEQKKMVAALHECLTSENKEDTLAFLNFEDEAFCS